MTTKGEGRFCRPIRACARNGPWKDFTQDLGITFWDYVEIGHSVHRFDCAQSLVLSIKGNTILLVLPRLMTDYILCIVVGSLYFTSGDSVTCISTGSLDTVNHLLKCYVINKLEHFVVYQNRLP